MTIHLLQNALNGRRAMEANHVKQTFRDEYLELLKEFEIGYDEQYIFQELI